MNPLLCVRHEVEDDGGLAIPTFESAGLPILTWDAWNGDSGPPDLDDVSGLTVFGGTMNVDQTAAFPFLATERGLVRRALDQGLPYLGICLGAQMLARALDEPVVPAPARALGFTPVHPTAAGRADALVSLFGDGAMTFHWNEDTFVLPPDSELLATGADGSVQAFRHREAAWGLVFHPEVTGSELSTWLEASDRATLAGRWGTDPDALRSAIDRYLPAHEDRGRELFRRFAEVVRVRSSARVARRR